MPETTRPRQTWSGDACSLVDAYRDGSRSPVEEIEACLAAIEASELNAFSFVDADRAIEAAKNADVSLPFGGVPMGDGLWPECRDDLTREMAMGFEMAFASYDLAMAARVERSRTELNEQMAAVFDEVDFVISATNPDVAYPAHITANTRVGETKVGLENNGVLTIPANIVGNPAVSVPVEPAFGLPVGMQIMARHHEDELLLDLARIVEQTLPWPTVAPAAPC